MKKKNKWRVLAFLSAVSILVSMFSPIPKAKEAYAWSYGGYVNAEQTSITLTYKDDECEYDITTVDDFIRVYAEHGTPTANRSAAPRVTPAVRASGGYPMVGYHTIGFFFGSNRSETPAAHGHGLYKIGLDQNPLDMTWRFEVYIPATEFYDMAVKHGLDNGNGSYTFFMSDQFQRKKKDSATAPWRLTGPAWNSLAEAENGASWKTETRERFKRFYGNKLTVIFNWHNYTIKGVYYDATGKCESSTDLKTDGRALASEQVTTDVNLGAKNGYDFKGYLIGPAGMSSPENIPSTMDSTSSGCSFKTGAGDVVIYAIYQNKAVVTPKPTATPKPTVTPKPTATPAPSQVMIDVIVEEGEGTVTGGGPYNIGDVVKAEAIPAEGWAFKKWEIVTHNASNTTITKYNAVYNTYKVTKNSATFKAYFEKDAPTPMPTKPVTPVPTEPPHNCTWSGWIYDDNQHWQENICDPRKPLCQTERLRGDHIFPDNPIRSSRYPGYEILQCDVCGYIRYKKAISSNVKFDANGGAFSNGTTQKNLTVTYDSTTGSVLSNEFLPKRDGYSFGGWYLQKVYKVYDETNHCIESSYWKKQQDGKFHCKVETDLVLYAYWGPASYFVAYNVDGDTTMIPKEQWQFDVDYYLSRYQPVKNLQITYHGNAPINQNNDAIVHADESETTFPLPFLGWGQENKSSVTYTAAECKNGRQTRNLTSVDGAVVTMYAIWGNSTSAKPPAKAPELYGYSFEGWYDNPECTGTKYSGTFTITKDMDLYAKWVPKSLTISFDSNGGSACADLVGTYQAKYGLGLTTRVPTKAGYEFKGWFPMEVSDNGIGTKVTENTIIVTPDNHTLYAKWEAGGVKVSFDTNGGTACAARTGTYKGLYGELPLPSTTKKGHEFVKWVYNGNEITANSVIGVSYNHTLTAEWSPKTYIVSFDSAGGTPCDPISVVYNTKYGTLPPTWKPGSEFAGWVLDETVITSETVMTRDYDHTLTAKWNPIGYTVTLDYNFNYNATAVNPQMNASYDSYQLYYMDKYGTLPGPARNGYTFVGWYDKESNNNGEGNQITKDTVFDKTTNVTIYARWVANTYNAKFDYNYKYSAWDYQ